MNQGTRALTASISSVRYHDSMALEASETANARQPRHSQLRLVDCGGQGPDGHKPGLAARARIDPPLIIAGAVRTMVRGSGATSR